MSRINKRTIVKLLFLWLPIALQLSYSFTQQKGNHVWYQKLSLQPNIIKGMALRGEFTPLLVQQHT